MKYSVMVDSNSSYMDESERYCAGEFEQWEDALDAAKGIVDRSLEEFDSSGKTADELYQYYCMFGDDSYIIGSGNEFSAREYAKKRCEELAGA